MKTEIELFENGSDTTSVNGKKLREYINENYISNSVLDKIRAEIESDKIEGWTERNGGLEMAIKIIDKYKESEEKE